MQKKYTMSGFNIGGGVEVDTGGKILEAMEGGGLELVDERADCPDPYAANGSAWLSGVSAAFALNISFLSTTRLGRLRGSSMIDVGLQGGISLSATIGMGSSAVHNVEKEDCCES
ncbi:MAG: hypothetical protein KA972_04735 [Brachymonas sp.]|jgi:hypothetical protein|nr:hypothetical protein [Brachymonas sp.]